MQLKRYRWLILLYALFIIPQVSRAEESPFGFYFTTRRKQVRIPFQFRSNLIIVPVRLNEQRVVNFIVDTGVTYSIITDATIFQQIPLTISRKIALSGIGEGDPQQASVSIQNSISLGKVRTDNQTLLILQKDVLHLSEYAGMPIHGIIGYELFANLVVRFDFQNRIMTLIQPDHYHYRPGKGERCPLIIHDNKVYTDVLTIRADKVAQLLRVLIDTGAGQALLVDQYQPLFARPSPDQLIRLPLGHGLTGLVNGQLGRLPFLCIGRYRLKNVLVAYPDSSNFNQKIDPLFQRQGNIGCDLLRRFRVTFHYGAGYMVLKPVKSIMLEPFEHDMSGLEIQARGSQFNRYFISRIIPYSPADQAGLQTDDELLTINNQPVNCLNLGDIYQLLTAGEAKPIDVLIRRTNQLIRFHFLLKHLI